MNMNDDDVNKTTKYNEKINKLRKYLNMIQIYQDGIMVSTRHFTTIYFIPLLCVTTIAVFSIIKSL